ncbi:MAG: radical SAM protein [Thermodesulfobacteriota bacterium]|nr:radical SAM protein [Thermodesulfobacteriota bacterium]
MTPLSICQNILSYLHRPRLATRLRDQNPVYLVLNLTRRCNMRCPHCLLRQHDKDFFSDEDMAPAHAKEILSHFYDRGVRKLILAAEGEITMYPHLREVAAFSKEIGFEEIGGFTNGILLGRHIDCLATFFDFIYVSVDGYDNETYARHRGVDGVFDAVTANIGSLVEAKSRSGRRQCIAVVCVVSQRNYASMEKMIRLAEGLQVDRMEFFNFHAVSPDYEGCHPLRDDDRAVVRYLHDLICSRRYAVEIILPALVGNKTAYYCPNLFGFVMVGTDGSFSPCNYFPTHEKYGNFFRDPDAFRRKEISRFKKALSRAGHPSDLAFICRECVALSPENFIYFPSEDRWKRRFVTGPFEYGYEDVDRNNPFHAP